MVRTILIPKKADIHLSIPEEYIGKEIEITYLALDELESKKEPVTMSEFFGILDDKTYEALKKHTEKARKEWNRSI